MSPAFSIHPAIALGILLLWGGGLGGQTLSDATLVTAARRIEIPAPARYPTLLVVHGHRKVGCGDVKLRLDGEDRGRLSAYVTGPGTFAAWLPIERPPQPTSRHVLVVEPLEGGAIVGPVEVLPAGYVDVDVVDAGTRRPTTAWVRIAAVSTMGRPHFGRNVASGVIEDVILCPSGSRRVVLPADRKVTLVAGGDPFRATIKRLVRPSDNAPLGARFLLPPSLKGDGVLVQASEERPFILTEPQRRALDRVLGIDQRLRGFMFVPAADAEGDVAGFVERLLADGRPIVIDAGRRHHAAPAHHRTLRTARRPAHGTLHSNGPILWCERLRRYRGGPRPISGEIRLRLPSAVEGGHLEMRTADDVLARKEASGDTAMALEADLAPGTLVAVRFQADAYAGEPMLAPSPLAILLFRVP